MKRFLLVAAVLGAAVAIGMCSTDDGRCEGAFLTYGVTLDTCPSGTMRQTAELSIGAARRGAKAPVTLTVKAHYTENDADSAKSAYMTRIESVTLELVDATQKATVLPTLAPWKNGQAEIKVPEVPDGDYIVRAKYATTLGAGTLEASFPLYTPARIHVLTDCPLYEPGNTVKFRALALRARDLAPLDNRPGRWLVTDPDGETLLEESAPAGEWGVVAGSFPIDSQARTGMWKVAWESGGVRDEVEFKVEPFKLPRFRVDASTDKTFYRAGDKPTLTGTVVYSSGAPVEKAKIELTWSVDGGWPPPSEWLDEDSKVLPKKIEAGKDGRFEIAMPEIPKDLQGQARITARISATDAAGDRVDGRATALLSEDGIAASTVTELGDGLVEGFNNRLFVRVTTPDGAVVTNTKAIVRRAWDPTDKGTEADVDEDGVASLQFDPGAPVNIVIPAVPYRPAPRAALVTRGEIEDLIRGEGASLAEQVEMDRWLPALGTCAKWAGAPSSDGESEGSTSATLGMRIDRNGTLVVVGSDPSPLGTCAANVVRGKRLPGGPERLFRVDFEYTDPELPSLSPSVTSAFEQPGELESALENVAAGARDCLPRLEIGGELPKALTWRVKKGAKEVELGPWIDVEGDKAVASALGCAQQRYGSRIPLTEAVTSDALGIVSFTLQVPETVTSRVPQPTTMIGYELVVSVPSIPGAPSTKVRVNPGSVPQLRLRVSPVVVKPGQTVTAEVLRGPEFTGGLPKELVVRTRTADTKVKLDAERKAEIVIDPKAEGWVEILGGSEARALVFVQPQRDLTVSVKPGQARYAPGEQAQLAVQTKIAGQGAQAAVGLFGVDESLGQLVTLEGPDSLGRVQPKVGTSSPAFGTLDGQALTLGRVRGANAAAATVLRVSSIPSAPELDAEVTAQAQTHFDPVEELTDNFYTVLAELHAQTRTWEATAPATEKMQPVTMAKLWKKALAACKARGEKVVDAYGRELRLIVLPPDLLALTDPRAVVVVATRLPEDVENWAVWVAKEKP